MKILLLVCCLLNFGHADSFNTYPAPPVNLTPLPRIHGPRLSVFRGQVNRLLKEYKAGQVQLLANRYLLTQVGCGTECVVVIGVDLKTGLFKIFNDLYAFDLDFRPNSRLLVINKGGLRLSNFYPEEHFVFDDNFTPHPELKK